MSGATTQSTSGPTYDLSQFQIERELGVGSFGIVKQVQHIETNEVFAMKVLEKRKIIDNNLQEQLKREVVAQLRAHHPNVVKMHYYFEDALQVYFLLEFADKGQLFSYLRERKRLQEVEAYRFFLDVTQGLIHLHSLGIIHRDLKPENVLLYGKELQAKIGDFGWCVQLTAEESERRTFCGTMDYLAPEMIGNDPHDHSVDVWAIGVLLFEMIAGKAPFEAESQRKRIQLIEAATPTYSSEFSEEAKNLIGSLLMREKHERMSLADVLRHPWVLQKTRGDHNYTKGAELSAAAGPVASVPRRILEPQKVEDAKVDAAAALLEHNTSSQKTPPMEAPEAVSSLDATVIGSRAPFVSGESDARPVSQQASVHLHEDVKSSQPAPEDEFQLQMEPVPLESLNNLSGTMADVNTRITTQLDELDMSFQGRISKQVDRQKARLQEIKSFEVQKSSIPELPAEVPPEESHLGDEEITRNAPLPPPAWTNLPDVPEGDMQEEMSLPEDIDLLSDVADAVISIEDLDSRGMALNFRTRSLDKGRALLQRAIGGAGKSQAVQSQKPKATQGYPSQPSKRVEKQVEVHDEDDLPVEQRRPSFQRQPSTGSQAGAASKSSKSVVDVGSAFWSGMFSSSAPKAKAKQKTRK